MWSKLNIAWARETKVNVDHHRITSWLSCCGNNRRGGRWRGGASWLRSGWSPASSHLSANTPPFWNSEIWPHCDNSLNQEEMRCNAQCFDLWQQTLLFCPFPHAHVCQLIFLGLLMILCLIFSKLTCLRGWYRPWQRGDRGRPRGGCWRWCTWWTPRPRAWSRARARSECRWSCSSSLWRHTDLRWIHQNNENSSVANVYLSWYWKTKSRIFLSMKDSAYCLLLYLKTMFSLNCHRLYQSIYSLPTKSKLWCIFASAMAMV